MFCLCYIQNHFPVDFQNYFGALAKISLFFTFSIEMLWETISAFLGDNKFFSSLTRLSSNLFEWSKMFFSISLAFFYTSLSNVERLDRLLLLDRSLSILFLGNFKVSNFMSSNDDLFSKLIFNEFETFFWLILSFFLARDSFYRSWVLLSVILFRLAISWNWSLSFAGIYTIFFTLNSGVRL